MSSIHVDVVSAEQSIFAGEAKFIALPGESGELGILPGHTPSLQELDPVQFVLRKLMAKKSLFSSPAAFLKYSQIK